MNRRCYGFGTTWGWVINDRIFILGWSIPLKQGFPNTFPEPPQHCTFCIFLFSDTPISGLGVATNELMSWIRCDKGDMLNVQCWGGSRNEFGKPCFKVWGWFQTQPRSPDSLETFRQVRLSSLHLNSAGHWLSRSRIGHALSILFRPALKHTIQVRGRQRRSRNACPAEFSSNPEKTSPACSPSNSEDLD